MMKAITAGDRLHALSPAFKRKVDKALNVIQQAATIGRIGVSYSGGKDSTVMLDLIRTVVPDALAGHYDSGCEYDWTYDLMPHYNVISIKPEMDLLELCRYGGHWGYPNPVDVNANIDFDAFLVYEPAQRFIAENDLKVLAMGLRAKESYGRRMSAIKNGEIYYCQYDEIHHLCPVAFWNTNDIWAYIASRNLRYNEAYDRMAIAGIAREDWRVSTLLGSLGLHQGRLSVLRQIAPEKFRELAEEFPAIKSYT